MREEIYESLYYEIDGFRLTPEGAVIEANKLDLLKTLSALTDAVEHGKLSLSEAKYMLRGEINRVLAPPPKTEAEAVTEEPDTGVVKF